MSTESIHYQDCPICGGTLRTWRTIHRAAADYTISVCLGCGYAFVNPRPNQEAIAEYYTTDGHTGGVADSAASVSLASVLLDEELFPNSTLDASAILAEIDALQTGRLPGKFLDVGSGYGFFTKAARERGYQVTAVDLAANERQVFRDMNGFLPVCSTFEDFQSSNGEWDVVLMSQILEHAVDVNQWIAKAARLLSPGGLLIVAVPNFSSLTRRVLGPGCPFITPPTHLNYFSAANLRQLLAKHGLVPQKTNWVSRLPTTAVSKRLPWVANAAGPLTKPLIAASCSWIDAMRLGMIVRVIARNGGS